MKFFSNFRFSSTENINRRDKYGRTTIHVAAERGNLAEIKRLLAVGADIDCRTSGTRTSLHIAAEHGHLDVVRFLHDNGADVDDQTETGYLFVGLFCVFFRYQVERNVM